MVDMMNLSPDQNCFGSMKIGNKLQILHFLTFEKLKQLAPVSLLTTVSQYHLNIICKVKRIVCERST